MTVRHGNVTQRKGHSHYHKRASREFRVRKEHWYQSQLGSQGVHSQPAPGPWSPHLGTGANTVRPCSTAPDSQTGLGGAASPLERGGGTASFQRLCCSAFTAPAEHGPQGWGRRVEPTHSPHGCPELEGLELAGALGPLSTWGLGDATCSVSELGGSTPWYRQRGSWHLVAGPVPARAAESGSRGQDWGSVSGQ